MFSFPFRSKRSGSSGPPRARRRLRDLRGDASGSSAVEFALVAVPFLGIICGTMEFAVVYWAQLTLDTALADASRTVYTGAFQSANEGRGKSQAQMIAALRNQLCTKDGQPRATMFVCQNVRLNVSTSQNFSGSTNTSATSVDPNTNATTWNSNFGQYSNGGPSAIMRVQAAVDFPVFFTIFNIGSNKAPNGKRLLQAASVFRVEPYN